MEVTDQERARTFAQTLLDDVFTFSSEAFQRSVWIQGDHPKRYVHDYVEAVEMLHDFASWLLDDSYYRYVPFTEDQAERLRDFQRLVEKFDDELPVRDAQHATAHPKWGTVVAEAKAALVVLSWGDHGLRPQLTDPIQR